MLVCASTGPVLDRCFQHRPSIGPVLAHMGLFMAFHLRYLHTDCQYIIVTTYHSLVYWRYSIRVMWCVLQRRDWMIKSPDCSLPLDLLEKVSVMIQIRIQIRMKTLDFLSEYCFFFLQNVIGWLQSCDCNQPITLCRKKTRSANRVL